ncbi:MAG: DUF692 domain-containing protein [Armatimonadota bacterium]
MSAVAPAEELSHLPVLGVGLGFREPFRAELFRNRGKVDFLEITAEHYLDVPAWKDEELALLTDHFPLIPHGLGLSLGSAEGLDPAHLERLARLVNRLRPPWWSEHLAFTRAGGVEIGHLAPLPFTEEAVEAVCRNVELARSRIDAPLILENITYALELPGAEMTEAQFIRAVLERTGCGLLLDVTNLYVNGVNHRRDPYALLHALPLERVVQLHFVGVSRRGGLLVDDHAAPTPPEVWELLEEVLRRAPVKGVILERDARLPALSELLPELERARELGRRHGRWD